MTVISQVTDSPTVANRARKVLRIRRLEVRVLLGAPFFSLHNMTKVALASWSTADKARQ